MLYNGLFLLTKHVVMFESSEIHLHFMLVFQLYDISLNNSVKASIRAKALDCACQWDNPNNYLNLRIL